MEDRDAVEAGYFTNPTKTLDIPPEVVLGIIRTSRESEKYLELCRDARLMPWRNTQ